MLDGLRDAFGPVRLGAHVEVNEERVLAQLADHLLCEVIQDVRRDDPGAFGDEQAGRLLTGPSGCPRDEDDLALDPSAALTRSHALSSFLSCLEMDAVMAAVASIMASSG